MTAVKKMPLRLEVFALCVPVAFISWLLWLRLRAGGATVGEARKAIGIAPVWFVFALLGVKIAAHGLAKENDSDFSNRYSAERRRFYRSAASFAAGVGTLSVRVGATVTTKATASPMV